ncbi:MAG: hypothetical protein K2Q45_03860 [Nitrosomonas sp.]|nr:hypothetical protein [Nitrosomonas sp.]
MSNSDSSSSSSSEEPIQMAAPLSSPEREEEEHVLSIEEENEAPVMPKKKKESKKRTKKEAKAEAKVEGERVYEDDKEVEIDLPKTTKRMTLAKVVEIELEKTNARERTLIVNVPGKNAQQLFCRYIDFPEDEIVPKVKAMMQKHELKSASSFEVAQFAPALFWNCIYHWGSVEALEQKLVDADIPNGKRHQKRRKTVETN